MFRDGAEQSPSGRRNTRIVKIVFRKGGRSQRLAFLRDAKKFVRMPNSHRRPYVRPDLTYAQRQADKKLQDSLWRLRRNAEASGSDDKYKIRNGKLYCINNEQYID